MGQQVSVREGQRYAELIRLCGDPRVWEVESVCEDAASLPHARLVNVSDRQHFKTISCRTLTNDKNYRLVT